jgi:hypothetical protein
MADMHWTWLIVLLTSFSAALSCSERGAGKIIPFTYQPPLQGYLTDGSGILWKDTVKWPENSEKPDYEFLFEDEDVRVGERELDQTQHSTLEAEWIIYFPEGIPAPEKINEYTTVCLTGMAETKYMGAILDKAYEKGEMPWTKLTLKNDVIAKGDCISATLGDIANGRIDAEVVVKEKTQAGSTLTWKNRAHTLADKKLVPYLQFLSQDAQKQRKRVLFVNLGATDNDSAMVNSWWRLIKSSLKSLSRLTFSKENVAQIMFCDAIRNQEYTQSGTLEVLFKGKSIASAKITTLGPKTSASSEIC